MHWTALYHNVETTDRIGHSLSFNIPPTSFFVKPIKINIAQNKKAGLNFFVSFSEALKNSRLVQTKRSLIFLFSARVRGRPYTSRVKFVVTWNILKVIWYTSLKTGKS